MSSVSLTLEPCEKLPSQTEELTSHKYFLIIFVMGDPIGWELLPLWLVLGIIALLFLYLLVVRDSQPAFNVRGKHVVITGGSSGIGKAVAAQMIKKGANVTLIARNVAKLEEVKRLAWHGSSINSRTEEALELLWCCSV